jgi:hypothetical protein
MSLDEKKAKAVNSTPLEKNCSGSTASEKRFLTGSTIEETALSVDALASILNSRFSILESRATG